MSWWMWLLIAIVVLIVLGATLGLKDLRRYVRMRTM